MAFDPVKFSTLAAYIWHRCPMPSEDLAWVMMRSDFEAYARLGKPITGATYLRGRRYPEVQEAGVGWFRRFVQAQLPWWAKWAGAAGTLYAVRCALKPGTERTQIAFMECPHDGCKGEGRFYNDSGNYEWFIYEGDPDSAWNCSVCGKSGRRYPY